MVPPVRASFPQKGSARSKGAPFHAKRIAASRPKQRFQLITTVPAARLLLLLEHLASEVLLVGLLLLDFDAAVRGGRSLLRSHLLQLVDVRDEAELDRRLEQKLVPGMFVKLADAPSGNTGAA